MPIALAILTGILMLGFTWKLFFSSWEQFGECVGYWLTPDAFSFFSGHYWEDMEAEFKLGCWALLGGGSGFLVFYLLN